MAIKKTYVMRNRKLVEVQRAPYNPVAPTIYTDTIPTTYCHGTGQSYDSRSARRDALKASGVVEVDQSWTPRREEVEEIPSIVEDLKRTQEDLRWGRSNELTESERMECKRLDERDGYKPLK